MTTRRIAAIAAVLLGGGFAAQAQETQQSERDRLYTRYLEFPSLVRGGVVQPRWLADSNNFWYAEGTPDKTVIYRVDPRANTRTPLFDPPRLREGIRAALGYDPPWGQVPFRDFSFTDRTEKAAKFTLEGRDYVVDLNSYTVTVQPPIAPIERERTAPQLVRKGFAAGSPDVMELLSPDRRWFVLERDRNLWLRSTYDGRREPLTTGGIEDFGWEMDNAKWSNNGLFVAARKVDRRQVLRMPLLHWLKPTEEVEWVPYTKVGGPLPLTELYVIDVASKRPVKLEVGDTRDQLFSLIGWSKDDREVYLYRMSRDHKRLDVLAGDPTTGTVRTLITETQPTFIKGIASTPGWRDLFNPLDDGTHFIFISERDGWDHLYLYRLDGTLVRRLTSGSWPVVRFVGADTKNGWAYFMGHAEKRVYDTHLYRVSLEGKDFARLTEGEGQHSVSLSPSKQYFVDNHSSIDRPPSSELRTTDGKPLQTLGKADVSQLAQIKWKAPEEFVVKAADGTTDLYGILYKPHDFDPSRKYPVIDFIYNGPQTTWVERSFAGGRHISPQAIAQLGFITFSVDGRGTVERGKAFQDVVYRNWGRNEIPDHVAALKQLAASRPYIDADRAGITGGSWGGYMTVRAMVLAPEVYQVGVSNVPVVDLYDHSTVAEPYMDLVERNREGYEYASSLRLADKLRGKLLLAAGTLDVNATFAAPMKMVEALTRANKPYDLIIMPNQNHWYAGVSQRYYQNALRRYFEDHLLHARGPDDTQRP
jgi:dipeptidyl aminopeptidase/acylaminoacyl peptidase